MSLSASLGVLGTFTIGGTVSRTCIALTGNGLSLDTDALLAPVKAAIVSVVGAGSPLVARMVELFLDMAQAGVASAFRLANAAISYSTGSGCSSSRRKLQSSGIGIGIGMILQDMTRTLPLQLPTIPTFNPASIVDTISQLRLDTIQQQFSSGCLHCSGPVTCACWVEKKGLAKLGLGVQKVCDDGSFVNPSAMRAGVRVVLHGNITVDVNIDPIRLAKARDECQRRPNPDCSALGLPFEFSISNTVPLSESWDLKLGLEATITSGLPVLNFNISIPYTITVRAAADLQACISEAATAFNSGGGNCFTLESADFSMENAVIKDRRQAAQDDPSSIASCANDPRCPGNGLSWSVGVAFSASATIVFAKQFSFAGVLSRSYSLSVVASPGEQVCTQIVGTCSADSLSFSASYTPGVGLTFGCAVGFQLPLVVAPSTAYTIANRACSSSSGFVSESMCWGSRTSPPPPSAPPTPGPPPSPPPPSPPPPSPPPPSPPPARRSRSLATLHNATSHRRSLQINPSAIATGGWQHYLGSGTEQYYVSSDLRRITNWLNAETIRQQIVSTFNRNTLLTALGDMRASWDYTAPYAPWGAISGQITVEATPSSLSLSLAASLSILGVSVSGALSIDSSSGGVVSGSLIGSGGIDFSGVRDALCESCPTALQGSLALEILEGNAPGIVSATLSAQGNPLGISGLTLNAGAAFNLTVERAPGLNVPLVWSSAWWHLPVQFGSTAMDSNLLIELPPHSDSSLSAAGLPRLGCRFTGSSVSLVDLLSVLASFGSMLGGMPLQSITPPTFGAASLPFASLSFAIDAEVSSISDGIYRRGLFISLSASAASYGGFTAAFTGSVSLPFSGTECIGLCHRTVDRTPYRVVQPKRHGEHPTTANLNTHTDLLGSGVAPIVQPRDDVANALACWL